MACGLRLNVIAVFDTDGRNVLMCRRRKEPYKGLLNFTGGHIEEGESGLAAAYRELFEETSITREDIELVHFMDMTYYFEDSLIEVYAGRLNKPTEVRGSENELVWCGTNEDFFDVCKFAGVGNIGHIIGLLKADYGKYAEKLP